MIEYEACNRYMQCNEVSMWGWVLGASALLVA